MRQVQVRVPRERAARVLAVARGHGAFTASALGAEGSDDEAWRLVVAAIPNERVGGFVEAVAGEVTEAEFLIVPGGLLALRPPLEEVGEALGDVTPKSALELVAGARQSVGSWRSLLLYALYSGVAAAYGIVFDVVWVLIAAMLISPLSAPIMVSVVGVAAGDRRMSARGGARFLAGVAVQVAAALAVGYAYRLQISTDTMETVTSLSGWTVLLALVAGAAGAQSQVQSERASLVGGAATGFLVAAALATTATVLGLSVVLARWDYLLLMVFLLALQYFAIVCSGALSLRLFGIRPDGGTLGRGSRRGRNFLLAACGALVVGLVAWQANLGPRFLKADLSTEARELAVEALDSLPGARLVSSAAAFTRPDLPLPGETLLLTLVVERTDPAAPDSAVERAVRQAVSARVRGRLADVVPYVDVTVLPGVEP